MAIEDMPRIRLAPIPTGALLVVRGDDVEAVMAADARRFHRRFGGWGRFGVSGFVARDAAEVDALCQTRLIAWGRVSLFRRAVLEESGIEVVATFRTPHVTLAHVEIGELLRMLSQCEHEIMENPYHEGEPGPPEAS